MLVLFSALISGSEVAFFSLKPGDIETIKKSNSKYDKLILNHIEESSWLLATILIANNFVNVGIVILSALISEMVLNFGSLYPLKFIFETVIITSVILFFGEILPKIYASQHCHKFARIMSYPLYFLKKVTFPLGYILVKSTNIVNKRLAGKSKSLSLDDLSQALELTANELKDEKEILEGIVKFGNLYVEEIMTPRVDVIDIDNKSDFNKVLAVIIESGYSRIPVFEDTPDNVKGVLYVKDLLPYLDQERTFHWQSVIRPAYYVPETKKINDLLSEFKAKKIHMAIVVDEYGGTAGIVTLEDILEEIVGDISDEMDDDEALYSHLPDGSIIFEGKILLNDFYKVSETNEKDFEYEKGDAETLAGLLLELKGEIPQKGETIEFKDFSFTIASADNRRIKKVRFKKMMNFYKKK
ncbi:MAG: gliding motility-associated protein GldE [Marinilabiliaceae bacterium]|nr:gliding motility-associated protein GldE [Marinilabiliaceae bacterium]